MHENKLTSADPPGAVDPLQHPRRLGLTPSLTSKGLRWRGIEVGYYRHSLREIEQLSFESHIVALVVRPWRVERHREGRVDKVSHAPGDVGLIPAGSLPARWIHEGEADTLLLSSDPAFVEEVAEKIGADDAELLDTLRTRDPRIEQIGLSLKAELEAGDLPGGELYAESLANALAVHLLREHSSLGWGARRKAAREPNKKGGLSAHALQQALDFIGDNLASDLSLAEIAAVANLSPHHFSRLFKLSSGLSPHQYVIRERVEKAKALLSGIEMAVDEVVLACGFSHQAHLSRHFGRRVGTSPKKFRR